LDRIRVAAPLTEEFIERVHHDDGHFCRPFDTSWLAVKRLSNPSRTTTVADTASRYGFENHRGFKIRSLFWDRNEVGETHPEKRDVSLVALR
jgi:hypothetical protein